MATAEEKLAYLNLAKLREPFPPSQIGKLPKGGIQLDFVGHGYLTQRMLEVDPLWNWEPFALDANGLPLLDEFGGLWIKLTICGVTRPGYGDAAGRKGPNAIKEAIGDALRNAGMRFGLALDLWSKGDPDAPVPKVKSAADFARDDLLRVIQANKLDPHMMAAKFKADYGMDIQKAGAEAIIGFTTVLEQDAAVDKAAD